MAGHASFNNGELRLVEGPTLRSLPAVVALDTSNTEGRPVLNFLRRLPREGTYYLLEASDVGFTLSRKEDGDPAKFDELAREAIGLTGKNFVVVPRLDASASYDQVVILTLDDPPDLRDA